MCACQTTQQLKMQGNWVAHKSASCPSNIQYNRPNTLGWRFATPLRTERINVCLKSVNLFIACGVKMLSSNTGRVILCISISIYENNYKEGYVCISSFKKRADSRYLQCKDTNFLAILFVVITYQVSKKRNMCVYVHCMVICW